MRLWQSPFRPIRPYLLVSRVLLQPGGASALLGRSRITLTWVNVVRVEQDMCTLPGPLRPSDLLVTI